MRAPPPEGGWSRVQELFHAAIAMPGEERDSFLDRECENEPDLQRELRSLIAADGRADELVAPVENAAAGLLGLAEGTRLGPYRILRELGRGGMGIVYSAERADEEFEQQVALKVLVNPAVSAPSLQRFLAERQILARLQHPCIARLLDGGTAADGRPYLVMEQVDGLPITEYCDSQRLTLAARLELFLTVCEAVAHAHRELIVHRDLKPSNLLVTALGEAKLLDFGIAKVLEPVPGDPLTRVGELPMTPEYASPEQVRGEPVSTASDVYGLGLLLYELLTGCRAHRMTSHDRAEIERTVCVTTPTRPSTTVRSQPPEVAAARRTSRRQLARRLAGDLDAILLRALRKEPNARYPSVDALAQDVRRHLDGHPVGARTGAAAYRLRRFLRRHWAPLTATAAIAVASAAGLVSTSIQAERARLEAERAEQVQDFLVDLLGLSDPEAAPGQELTVRDALDRARRRLDSELTSQPELKLALRRLIAQLYSRLGDYETADDQLMSALELQEETAATGLELELARIRVAQSDVARLRGNLEEAEQLARTGLSLLEAHPEPSPSELAGALERLGSSLRDRGDTDGARVAFGRAMHLLADTGRDTAQMAEIAQDWAIAETQASDWEAAEALYRQALDIHQALGSRSGRDAAFVLEGLAQVARWRNDYALAHALQAEATSILERILGTRHPSYLISLSNLALATARIEEAATATTLYRRAIDLGAVALGPDHPDLANFHTNLGIHHYRLEEYPQAIESLTRAAEVYERALGPDHFQVPRTHSYIALALAESGQPGAEALFRQALPKLEAALGADAYLVSNVHDYLGRLLVDSDRPQQALGHLQRAVTIRTAIFGDEDRRVATSSMNLGAALAAVGRAGEAEPLIRGARAIRAGHYGEESLEVIEVDLILADCEARLGRLPEARRLLDAGLRAARRAKSEEHWLVRLGRRVETAIDQLAGAAS